jgi:hypothetical protein
MKFLAAISVMIVLGFLGIRWVADSAPAARHQAGGTIVDSRTDAQRFAIQSQQDAGLNDIRQDAYMAANAYAASPCDEANKAKLVKAFSAYVEAAQVAYGCKLMCSSDEVRAAMGAFSTTLDKRVQAALRTAFSRGGIYAVDLPLKTRLALGSSDPAGSPAQCSGPNRQPRTTSRTYSRS